MPSDAPSSTPTNSPTATPAQGPTPVIITQSIVDCETDFARDSNANTCFLNIGFNRWGWTNGPYNWSNGPVNIVMDIYGGAGQCNLQSGRNDGTLTVTGNPASSGLIEVTWDAGNTAAVYTEYQLFVGDMRLPLDNNDIETVAPGQYGIVLELTTGTFETMRTFVVDVSGFDLTTMYVVAHAVGCRLET